MKEQEAETCSDQTDADLEVKDVREVLCDV